jgi:hypothetical protein
VFAELDQRHLKKLVPYVTAFNTAQRDAANHGQLFRDFVGFTLLAFQVYTQQVALLRKYLETESFRNVFKNWAGQNR